ncbi:AAA family ATPase [Rugosimonospora africana]|uniref:Tetratricopeptide repeat-containing protein n=1 Tax=Rugosimonospora africana TaxID=556532 RepID=A0A8J3VW68_9ACTN|nr:AAA family ATPase [Rugosimonospora africana]GIH20516.1 hypothetical protein Raf01_86880 [Rugosimonospora africana]
MSRPDDPHSPITPARRPWISIRTVDVIVFALGGLPALFTDGRVQQWAVAAYVVAVLTILVVRMRAAVVRRRPATERHRPGRQYFVPHDLPPTSSLFVGRDAELAAILGHLRGEPYGGEDTGESRPRLIVLHGEDGMGKTALAVKAAHLAAEVFPDGQLFARIGAGTAETAEPESPGDTDSAAADSAAADSAATDSAAADSAAADSAAADSAAAALAYFVYALQPRWQRLPSGYDELRERFEELTAERAVLFILDDARDAEVVRRLLPAGPRCAVLVTAATPLPGLPTTAPSMSIGPLDGGESLTVLGAIVGQQRIREQREAADEIVRVTQGHPLSVRAAAAGLAAMPHTRLAAALRRLGAPRSPEEQAGAAALDLSYALLSEQERAAVRALGLLPAQTFTPWMLAAVLGVDERAATRIADRLGFAGFVNRTSVDSVGVPEFVVPEAVYRLAETRLAETTSAEERAALRERLGTRARQRRRTDPARALRDDVFGALEAGALRSATEEARRAVAVAREMGDRRAEGLALAAFAEVRAELGNFEAADDLARAALAPAVVSAAAAARAHRCLGRLYRRAHQTELAQDELNRAYQEATGDPAEQLQALRELAVAQAQRTVSVPAAVATLRTATELYERHPELGERYRAGLSWAASVVSEAEGRYPESRLAIDAGLESARRHGQQLWLAWLTYRAAGLELTRAVNFEEVRKHGNEAIRLFSDLNHRYGKAHCRLVIGHAYLLEHGVDEAVTMLEEALENFINCGDRWAEAEACHLLGLARQSDNPTPEAGRLLRTAFRIFADLGDADKAGEVHERLARLAAPDGHGS